MKFSSHLTEATLLKRPLKFLAEVVLPNRQKLMIRCPNLSEMLGCDILGTKLWFSNAIGYHCLPTWELVEVDGGHLVSINPELMKPLVIEAIKQGTIDELSDYNILHTGGGYDQFNSQFLLLEKNEQQCYMGLEHVTLGDEQGKGYFPERVGGGIENLSALMQAKADGHRAILFYCVVHTGIDNIKPAVHIDQEYKANLQQAVSKGVEVLAYRTSITLQGIELSTPLNVMLSVDAISR